MVPPKLKATQAIAAKKVTSFSGANSSAAIPTNEITWPMVITRIRAILSDRIPRTRRPPRLAMEITVTAFAAVARSRCTIPCAMSFATPITYRPLMQAVRNITASIQYCGLRMDSARVKSLATTPLVVVTFWFGASVINMEPRTIITSTIAPQIMKVFSRPTVASSWLSMNLKPRLPKP